MDDDLDYRNADEQALDFGQGNAEVLWADKTLDAGKLNLSNMPIELAVKNASKMSGEEFAMIRRKGFGGSDASILVGANPYTKTYEEVPNKWEGTITDSLVKQKARLEVTEQEKAVSKKAAVRKGNALEPLIIVRTSEILGVKILKPDDMYRFKEFPYLTMNFDGVGIFLKPKAGEVVDPKGYIADMPEEFQWATESYIKEKPLIYPAPDFSFLGNHHGYAPVEIKVATITGQKNYNPIKAVYSEDRFLANQNPWIEAPTPLTDDQLKTLSVEEKAIHFGVPVYYYPQIQQEMMACDANGGFISVMFEAEWLIHIFYVQKDPYLQNQIRLEGYKAGKAVNNYLVEMGRPPAVALTPEMAKTMNLRTNLPQEASADDTVTLVEAPKGTPEARVQRELDPRWDDEF